MPPREDDRLPPDEQETLSSSRRTSPGPLPLPGDRPASFSSGEVLAGRFRIVRFLGQGGMGEVYEAEDLELKEHVALKTIRPEIASDERALARFKREIHLARKVTHPNVCRIFDLFRHQRGSAEVTFLTMELLRGETLAERLRRGGRMTPAEAQPIVARLAAGLAAAHQVDVIHRDFKSANVMLVPARQGGGAVRAVITDFGLARQPAGVDSSYSQSGSGPGAMVGTPAYMAPEQIKGGPITAATDIYALGVVMFEMVTGRRPFVGDTPLSTALKRLEGPPPSPRAEIPDLDPRWESVILRCLEREPSARFGDASSITDAIGGKDAARVAARPRQAALWAAALLILLAGATAYFLRIRPSEPEIPATAATLPSGPIQPRRSVAVVGFKNLSQRAEAAWLSTALSEMLTTELAAGEKLRTVPGENVARMKIELALAETDSLARDTLARVRANLGTDLVVLGSFLALGEKSGGQIRLDLRLQDAAAGEILASVAETGTEPQLFELVARTGARLREKLGLGELSAAQAGQVRASLPSNPEAARLYTEGLARLRQFDIRGGRDLLEKAAQTDPRHPLIQFALAGAWSSLGYDLKAKEAAKRAFDLSGNLLREERLSVEARYRESTLEWNRAIELYVSMRNFFPDNLEYGLKLADAQNSSGRSKDALATIEALRKLPPPSGDDPRLDLAEAVAARILADSKRAVESSARAAAKGTERGKQYLVARARFDEGSALHNLGQFDKGQAALEESERLFAAIGDRRGLAGALMNHGLILANRGDLAAARKLSEQALALYRQVGNPSGVALVQGNLGNFYYVLGDLNRARKRWEETLASYREIDDKEGMARMMNNIASALGLTGDVAGARKMFESALVLYREIGQKSGIAVALDNIATALRDEGNLTEAKKLFTEAQGIWREIGDKAYLTYSLHAYGELLRAEGDLAAARKAHEEALKVRTEIGAKPEAAESRLALSDLSLEEGRFDQAGAAARELVEVFRQLKDTDNESLAHGIDAQALLELGKLPEAQKAAERASALAGRSEKRGVRFAAAMTTALVRSAAGKPAEARKILEGVIAEATKAGLVGFQFDARWALAEVERKAGQTAAARALLEALEKDAASKGFGLIARKARQ